jgi:hypothetical protein
MGSAAIDYLIGWCCERDLSPPIHLSAVRQLRKVSLVLREFVRRAKERALG